MLRSVFPLSIKLRTFSQIAMRQRMLFVGSMAGLRQLLISISALRGIDAVVVSLHHRLQLGDDLRMIARHIRLLADVSL